MSEIDVAFGKSAELCAEDCLRCYKAALRTLHLYMVKGGEFASDTLLRSLQDCAEICELGASFLLRGSPSHDRIIAACSELTEQCAWHLERLANGDPVAQECIDLCHRVSESLRQPIRVSAA